MTDMPVMLVLLVTCSGTLAFALLGVIAVRRLLHRHIGDGHNDVLSAIFQAGGTIYAVFLAFLVVVVWQSYDAAHANIAEEASLLATLYRGSTAMEPASGETLRSLIRQYTHAVITDEWPVQARYGGTSNKARAAGLDMFRIFGSMPPQARQNDSVIDQVALTLIAQVQSDRNKRTLEAGESISSVIWSAAIVNGVFVVIMSFFLYADRGWPQIVMCSILAIMIATMLCVVFILQRPFGRLLPLDPKPFIHSLEVYDSVDEALKAAHAGGDAPANLR
jgi:hypothetical protein